MTTVSIPEIDQGMHIGDKPGLWWLECASDSRWNRTGTVDHLDNHSLHPEAQKAIDEIKERLGEEPPEDLIYTATRD